jgi:hypothetical protein
MRICDLNTGLGQLSQAFSQLKERLAETKTHWNDDTSRAFQQTHLEPILPKLQLTLSAIQHLSEILSKAEKELDDRAPEA